MIAATWALGERLGCRRVALPYRAETSGYPFALDHARQQPRRVEGGPLPLGASCRANSSRSPLGGLSFPSWGIVVSHTLGVSRRPWERVGPEPAVLWYSGPIRLDDISEPGRATGHLATRTVRARSAARSTIDDSGRKSGGG